MAEFRTENATVADWHGIQAIRQYNKGNMEEFRRHCRIADAGWAAAGVRGKEQLSRLQRAHDHQPIKVPGRQSRVTVLVNGKPFRQRGR
jgi:hypothetical protein